MALGSSPALTCALLEVGGGGPWAGPSLTEYSPLPAGWPGPAPSVSELERRRLEEALEAAQGEARGAQLREEQLQAECERLQGELKQLQETRAQVSTGWRVWGLPETTFPGAGLPVRGQAGEW